MAVDGKCLLLVGQLGDQLGRRHTEPGQHAGQGVARLDRPPRVVPRRSA
nr:hypothetical protein [Actinoplanes polyasparticus]